MDFDKAKIFMDAFLRAHLPSYISYHDSFHTLDVLNACLEIAKLEQISDEKDLVILKTAALFHDSGFAYVYNDHEEEGCAIARRHLPDYNYSATQIDAVCKLILVTKMPQQPASLLEQILCDADLDYLGRDDYEIIAKKLFDELRLAGKIRTEKEWIILQINFLESHHYWTKSATSRRQKGKENNLRKLKELANK